MNRFTQAMSCEGSKKLTENGANARNTSGNAMIDFYSQIGASRNKDIAEVYRLFDNAFAENPLLAIKTIFYARNVRGGLGERRVPRQLLNYVANKYPEIIQKNISVVPLFGRWDDLFSFLETPCENSVFELILAQWKKDIASFTKGEPISLMGKWLKSENTSSSESKRIAKLTAKKLGITPKSYRQQLTKFRKYANVVEVKMSSNQWESIDYPQVPSRAMKIYRDAFDNRDHKRFSKYIKDVENGDSKINSATLFPYDIVDEYLNKGTRENKVLELQWKSLPNYINGEHNILVMADVSGSMSGIPMATSIGLAMYFAERNSGPLKNHYMTFSEKPHFIKINTTDSLSTKVNNLRLTGVGYSTNMEAAFDYILKVAIDNSLHSNDLPTTIVVVTDNEINRYTSKHKWGFLEEMEARYNAHDYEMPNVVFWNADARSSTYLADFENPKVQFVSGHSPSVFKGICNGIGKTAYELMVDELSAEIYNIITI